MPVPGHGTGMRIGDPMQEPKAEEETKTVYVQFEVMFTAKLVVPINASKRA
jgi:hypothetical protein